MSFQCSDRIEEKDIDNFISKFKIDPSNNLSNPSLCNSLFNNQPKNVTKNKYHHKWNDDVMELSFHEYLHRSYLGNGIYKIRPCLNTVKTFLKIE